MLVLLTLYPWHWFRKRIITVFVFVNMCVSHTIKRSLCHVHPHICTYRQFPNAWETFRVISEKNYPLCQSWLLPVFKLPVFQVSSKCVQWFLRVSWTNIYTYKLLLSEPENYIDQSFFNFMQFIIYLVPSASLIKINYFYYRSQYHKTAAVKLVIKPRYFSSCSRKTSVLS